jgi:hypothetical protein
MEGCLSGHSKAHTTEDATQTSGVGSDGCMATCWDLPGPANRYGDNFMH